MPEKNVEMSNVTGDASMLTITVHTLAEAAALADRTQGELLHYGGLGEIKFCLRIPDDTVIFDIDQTTLDIEKTKSGSWERKMLTSQLDGYEPNERRDIKMLFLSTFDCKKIKAQGNFPFGQSVFHEGWRFNVNSILETIRPPRNKEPSITGLGGYPSLFGRLFATYPKSQREEVTNRRRQVDRKEVELTPDRLYVTDTDLQCFLQENPIQPDKLPIGGIFKVESYTSKKLEALNIARRYPPMSR